MSRICLFGFEIFILGFQIFRLGSGVNGIVLALMLLLLLLLFLLRHQPQQVAPIAVGEPPIIFGDGAQTMNFVYLTDVACANPLAATSGATDVAFNIGTGIETSLLDLARLLARTMGREDLAPVHVGDNPVNPVRGRLAAIDAARRGIGFEAKTPLEDGLRNLVAWWREQRSPPVGVRTTS